MLGASICQDKGVQKLVLKASGVPVADFEWFYDNEYLDNQEEVLRKISRLGYPCIVKPARLGSSVGITVAHDESEIKASIEEAIKYDEKICVEAMIKNLLEVDCAVLGNSKEMECSLIGEMITDNDFLTFEDKYIGEGSKKNGAKSGAKSSGALHTSGFNIPANIDKQIEKHKNHAFVCGYYKCRRTQFE